MTTNSTVETIDITMDQFDETKGVARGGRGPSGEVDVIRKVAVGKGKAFPRSTFFNADEMSEDGETVVKAGEFDDRNRVRLANRIMSDAGKNKYWVRTKRADDGSLLVMRITEAQYKALHPDTK